MDLRPKLIVRKGATCRHESRGSSALRAVCTQRYFSSWPIGVVEHRTTRHQGRDVSAGTTAGHHRHYGTWASALRQALVGMYPLRSDRACGTLSSRAAACRGKKPRPFARERYARSQSQSHQSPHLSALWLKLVSSIGNGHRPYGRSSSTLRMSLIGVAS